MGILREDGSPKPALKAFEEFSPELGLCQWFHFEDHRLEPAVKWLQRLGVTHLRTGLSWADWLRPGAERWFDEMMSALDDFTLTITFCFTPEEKGLRPHHTSPPVDVNEYAQFCTDMLRRYAPVGVTEKESFVTV
jgi:beta-xylosidase